jgi:hypothetical protein
VERFQRFLATVSTHLNLANFPALGPSGFLPNFFFGFGQTWWGTNTGVKNEDRICICRLKKKDPQ